MPWRGEGKSHRRFYHVQLRRVYFVIRRDRAAFTRWPLETPGDAIFERDFIACRAALKLYKSVKSRTIKINKSNFFRWDIVHARRMSTCTKAFVVPAQCDNQWNFPECNRKIVLMARITHDRRGIALPRAFYIHTIKCPKISFFLRAERKRNFTKCYTANGTLRRVLFKLIKSDAIKINKTSFLKGGIILHVVPRKINGPAFFPSFSAPPSPAAF